ncbi:response regulator receiver domain-containing protein [Kineococcus xinjiangensis]|uniref:Response regulator receiver domain-containing protein n=1 Tax=Kineococcus xinjiangensis TaxID=512762 RepID=A0A2S6IUT9_9ACTN|nr:response regulator [Kineococcus xinjiangensis]PPK98042.1 response regulator receiver domain-containing protein [Kineococcus xinjiangensis]
MSESASTGQVKILLVDDRPENLLALEAILQGLGHQLLRAGSGEEALKHLLGEEVSLILLDVQMPGMDGFETAEHVKRREKTRDIPIIFLTALEAGGHQAFRGYSAGAVDYLAKPFDPWVLRAKVGVFIELHEQRRALQRQRDRLQRRAQRDAEEMLALLERVEVATADAPPDVTARLQPPLAALRERLEERRR